MFATMRCLLSFTLVALAALALISDTVEAKHSRKSHPRKGVQILNDQGDEDDDGGQNGNGGNLIKWKSGNSFSANASLSVHTSISVNSNNKDHSWFNGNKMGLAGGQGLGLFDKVAFFYDWTCNPRSNEYVKKKNIPAIAMFWGIGLCKDQDNDEKRYEQCKRMKCGEYPYVAFLNEFDVKGDTMSGGMSIQQSFDAFNKYVLPHRKCGSLIIGPSCAMGMAETMCTKWYSQAKDKVDAISVHVFTTSLEATIRLIEHYLKFGLPIVITEMACIDYGKNPAYFCKADHIQDWFAQVTDYFNSQPMIVGWAASDAANGKDASFTQGGQGKSLTVVGKFIKELFKKFNKHGFNDESQRMQRRRI